MKTEGLAAKGSSCSAVQMQVQTEATRFGKTINNQPRTDGRTEQASAKATQSKAKQRSATALAVAGTLLRK